MQYCLASDSSYCILHIHTTSNTMNNKMFIVFTTVLLLGILFAEGCDMDQTRYGCRIQNKGCSCGFGCNSEYRYPTMRDCQDAIKGKRTDMCFTHPCMNNGVCIQISQHPGFKCRCEGTGFHGPRCQYACPMPGTRTNAAFPFECIEI